MRGSWLTLRSRKCSVGNALFTENPQASPSVYCRAPGCCKGLLCLSVYLSLGLCNPCMLSVPVVIWFPSRASVIVLTQCDTPPFLLHSLLTHHASCPTNCRDARHSMNVRAPSLLMEHKSNTIFLTQVIESFEDRHFQTDCSHLTFVCKLLKIYSLLFYFFFNCLLVRGKQKEGCSYSREQLNGQKLGTPTSSG